MSRGPGIVERSILAVFAATPDEILSTAEIACRALGKDVISWSEASSYRRALRRLVQKGMLADLSRSWRDNQRRFALPDRATAYQQRANGHLQS